MPGDIDNFDMNDGKATDDPIGRYLDSVVGAEDGEDSANLEATEGNKDASDKSSAEPTVVAKPSTSDNKDSAGKQGTDKKGAKDESKASPAAGDLTLQDGTVVKAGVERRLYDKYQEKAKLAESQLSMKTNELNQANASRQRVEQELAQLKTTVSSLNGADPQVVSTGLKLVKDLQRDPTGTLKALLTEALAAGYTIEGIGAGVDAQSIRAEVLKQFEPLQQQLSVQQQEQQTNQAIEQEVTTFYTQFPDARVHDDVIAAVIQKNPQLSLSEAYYQLRSATIDRGLDWSQPLAPQLAGEQQQQQTQQKPMVNGRTVVEGQLADADKTAVAHESTDMGSIIKSAMRDNGMKI